MTAFKGFSGVEFLWVGLVMGDAARLQSRNVFGLLLWGVGVACVGLLCWVASGRKPVKAYVVVLS